MMVVDDIVSCGTHGARGHSYLMYAFLKTDACSAVVRPLACAFLEEESRSTHGWPEDEYTTAIDGPYIRGGNPPPRCYPLSIPLVSRKLMEEARHVGSIPTPGQLPFGGSNTPSSEYQVVSMLKESIPVSLDIWETQPTFLIRLCSPRATCITCIIGQGCVPHY
jgi:hypothetical protein